MKINNLIMLSAVSIALLSACGGGSSNNNSPVVTPPTTPEEPNFPMQVATPASSVVNDNGSLILAESGLSLYTFDNDSNGQSNCNHTAGTTTSCALSWPPLLVANGAIETEKFTFITRDDNTQQWAYKNQPLYTFADDSAQGDINGDGVNNVWHLARPQPVDTTMINSLPTYVGNQTILSMTSTAEVLEEFRIDKNGFTLYTFDNDPINDSACSGNCINLWPPLLADSGAMAKAPLSIIDANNGKMQWAYKGKALYFFASDTAAGQTNGDNIGNVWHTATLEPAVQRVTNGEEFLSATGQVNVLVLAEGSTTEFEVQSQDKDGFALYTFDNDTEEVSNCVDTCLANWPAFVPNNEDEAIGDYTIFTRADGVNQWAYKGQPLYFFSNDLTRGDINGDNIGNVWHLVLPELVTTITEENNDLGAVLTVDGTVSLLITDADSLESTVVEQDMTGFALYTFDNDTDGVSNCTGGCLAAWPPLLATENDTAEAPYSIIDIDGGFKQWAINGMALYFFTPDETADDINGENANTIWHVARPAPIKVDDHETEGNLLVAHGNVLDSQGKTAAQLTGLTLYTFDSDIVDSGESTCFGGCAVTWPPLYASAADQAFGEYTIITRTEADDSTTFQWVYKGLPLYFFRGDEEVGDTLGDYPTWTIARP